METQRNTLVSVIMPVHNAASFLADAIKSIQAQTYPHWELIIVDDHSTDASQHIIRNYTKLDPRIKAYKVDKRKRGLASALNVALKQASGYFVARMDADDIALPTRLEKQVAYLNSHEQVIAVGSQVDVINDDGQTIGHISYPTQHEEIYQKLMFSEPINHGSLMTYAHLMKTLKYENNPTDESLSMFFRLIQKGFFANLPEALYLKRLHAGTIALLNPKERMSLVFWTRIKAVNRWAYKSTFKGVSWTLMQLALLTLVPEKTFRKYYRRMMLSAIRPKSLEKNVATLSI